MKFPFWKIGAAHGRGSGRNKPGAFGKVKPLRLRSNLAVRSLQDLAARNRTNGVKCAMTH